MSGGPSLGNQNGGVSAEQKEGARARVEMLGAQESVSQIESVLEVDECIGSDSGSWRPCGRVGELARALP
jgi:hypothetical protein